MTDLVAFWREWGEKDIKSRSKALEAERKFKQALVRLQSEQADPLVYRDAERARRVAREKNAAESRLKRLYADWEALAGELPDES